VNSKADWPQFGLASPTVDRRSGREFPSEPDGMEGEVDRRPGMVVGPPEDQARLLAVVIRAQQVMAEQTVVQYP
jgi:hypothetical protein